MNFKKKLVSAVLAASAVLCMSATGASAAPLGESHNDIFFNYVPGTDYVFHTKLENASGGTELLIKAEISGKQNVAEGDYYLHVDYYVDKDLELFFNAAEPNEYFDILDIYLYDATGEKVGGFDDVYFTFKRADDSRYDSIFTMIDDMNHKLVGINNHINFEYHFDGNGRYILAKTLTQTDTDDPIDDGATDKPDNADVDVDNGKTTTGNDKTVTDNKVSNDTKTKPEPSKSGANTGDSTSSAAAALAVTSLVSLAAVMIFRRKTKVH